jgi:phosphoribosylaminoimidazole-succinocarboxamide synthase
MAKDKFHKSTLMYEGSVKRIFGSMASSEVLVFEFTDDYSVFDWGKMPDTIPAKGEVLASLAALFFEKLRTPSEWQKYFSSSEGRHLVDALIAKSSFADKANSWVQTLQTHGLRTHYQDFDGGRDVLVQKINVQRPTKHTALGLNYYAYPLAKPVPFLIPLEVVFRFEVSAGSSFIKRNYDRAYKAGDLFKTPFIETFTKLEPQDRALATAEAFAMSGLTPVQFEELYFKTSLVAGILKAWFAASGVRLVDGKLEWGLTADGEVMLVDSMGPDEMRLEKQGLQLSKEILRDFYRRTPWYRELENAKIHAEAKGVADWKTLVASPPPLPPRLKLLISQMYQAVVNELRGQQTFPCPSLETVIGEMKTFLSEAAL